MPRVLASSAEKMAKTCSSTSVRSSPRASRACRKARRCPSWSRRARRVCRPTKCVRSNTGFASIKNPGIPGVFFAADSRSAQVCRAAIDAHVGTLAHPVDVALVQYDGAAIVHADVDPVVVTLHAVLDRIARQRAGSGTDDGGGVALACAFAVSQFAAGYRTDDAAKHGAGRVGNIGSGAARVFNAR